LRTFLYFLLLCIPIISHLCNIFILVLVFVSNEWQLFWIWIWDWVKIWNRIWVLIILFIYFANCIFYQLNDVFNLLHSQTFSHYNLLVSAIIAYSECCHYCICC
jgi:hypothetical protein